MSIDLIKDSSSLRQKLFQRAAVQKAIDGLVTAPVKHVVILFGGYGSAKAGEVLVPGAGPVTGTTALIEKVQKLKPSDGAGVTVRSYEGALNENNRAEHEMLEILQGDFHPLGKLILYGYSAGGFSAMRVAFRLGMSYPYYNTEKKAFLPTAPSPGEPSKTSNVVWGFARIDLLVTIDAAVGPLSGVVSRRVWPSVRKNLNIYQTVGASRERSSGTHSGVWSHGGPNTVVDEGATKVENSDWTDKYTSDPGAGHGKIDNDSIDPALAAIRQELDS